MWGKGKIEQWGFFTEEKWASGCHNPWGLSGEPYGMQGSWMTSTCTGQNPQGVLVTTALSEANTAWDSLSASGWQEMPLAALEAAASRLHYSCTNLLSPLSSHLGQGRHSGHLKHSWEPLGTPCSEEGNLESPGLQDRLLSARLTQPAEFRLLSRHTWQVPKELLVTAEMCPTPPQPFSEKILSLESEKQVFARSIIFFSTSSVSKGIQALHRFTVHVFAQRQMYEVHSCFMQKLWDFCHGCVPGHAIHTSHTGRYQLTPIHKDSEFHELENKAKDCFWMGEIWHLLHLQ